MTEALISELTRIRKLKVISGSLITKDVDRGNPVAEAAGPFDLLIGGSVTGIDHQVRVLVAIIDPQTQLLIWSHNYDRHLSEVLALQEEVACSTAAEVRVDLTPKEQTLVSTTLVKPKLMIAIFVGGSMPAAKTKMTMTLPSRPWSVPLQSIQRLRCLMLSWPNRIRGSSFCLPPHERHWEEKAFVAVEKALSLDPDLVVAHLARGRLLWTPANHFPHLRAIREYRRALALDPNLDEARNQLALVYCHIGFFDEALRESQEAAFTNPNNHLAVYRTAQTLAFQGKYEQALTTLRTIPQQVNPSLIGYQTAWVLFNLGNSKEASATIERLLKDYPEDDGALFVSMQAVLAASAGERHRAQTKIQSAVKAGKGFGHFHHAAYQIAIAFALMHEVEQAIQWLNAAAMDGFPCYPLFEGDAMLDNVRQDARFVAFMAQLRLQWLDFEKMF